MFLHLLVLQFIEDKCPEGLVLGLLSKLGTVLVDVGWVFQTDTSSGTQLSETLVPLALVGREFDLLVWVAVGGVVRVTDHVLVVGYSLAHVVHHAVFLGQLAADGFDRVNVSDFSHRCSAIERGVEIFKDISGQFERRTLSDRSSHKAR